MRPVGTAPVLPGLDTEIPGRRLMLACLNGQRRLRTVPGGPDMERWARAWARRWFVVMAPSADAARSQVSRYLDACAADISRGARASDYGIVEAGHNQAGGPDAFPARDRLRPRPRPAERARRRERALGSTSGGSHTS